MSCLVLGLSSKLRIKIIRQKYFKLLVEVWRIQLSALSAELGRDARYGQLPQYSRLSNSDPTLFSLLSAREDLFIASRQILQVKCCMDNSMLM